MVAAKGYSPGRPASIQILIFYNYIFLVKPKVTIGLHSFYQFACYICIQAAYLM